MKLKKYVKLVIFLFIFISINCCFILKANAINYTCKLFGDHKIVAKKATNSSDRYSYSGELKIDISNLEDIASVTIYVEYDGEKVWPTNCMLFNIANGGCSLTGEHSNTVWKTYREFSTSDMKSQLNKYSLFQLNLVPNYEIPLTETMEVTVSFKNAIDKDGNSITIEPCSRIFEFTDSIAEKNRSNDRYHKEMEITEKDFNSKEEQSIITNNESSEKIIPSEVTPKNNETNKETNLDIQERTKEESTKEEIDIQESTKKEPEKEQMNIQDSLNENVEKQEAKKRKREHNYIYIVIGGLAILLIKIILFIKNKILKKQWDDFDKF